MQVQSNKTKTKKKLSKATDHDIARRILGPIGRIVSHSKSVYQYDNPYNWVIYNARILTSDSKEEIWHGDIDLTLSYGLLEKLAAKLGTTVNVCYESGDSDASFWCDKKGTFGICVDFAEFKDKKVPVLKPDVAKMILDSAKFSPSRGNKYKRNEFKSATIKIPDVNRIKGDKENSPWTQFQQRFVKIHGLDSAKALYPSLYLSNNDYNKIEKADYDWYMRKKHIHIIKKAQMHSMDSLQLSCNTVSADCKWTQNKNGYIKKEGK